MHCWDYRRFICKFGSVDLKDEIEFTYNMIKQDFSNFSSHFYRSALLTEADQKNILKIKDIWDEEYDTITTALWVDPNDQSAWYYYGWLLSAYNQETKDKLTGSDQFVKAVLFDDVHKLLIFYFNQAYKSPPFDSLKVWRANESIVVCPCWQRVDENYSLIWYFKCDLDFITNLDFSLNGQNLHIEFEQFNETCGSKIWRSKSVQSANLTKKVKPLTQEKINNLKSLLDMEPENKCKSNLP